MGPKSVHNWTKLQDTILLNSESEDTDTASESEQLIKSPFIEKVS